MTMLTMWKIEMEWDTPRGTLFSGRICPEEVIDLTKEEMKVEIQKMIGWSNICPPSRTKISEYIPKEEEEDDDKN